MKSNLYLLDQKTKGVLNPLGNFLSSSTQPVCELQWLKKPKTVITYRKLFRQNSKNTNTIMSTSLPFCTKNLADGPCGVFESLQRTGGGEERKMLPAARRHSVFPHYTPTSYSCIEVFSVTFTAILSSFNMLINICFNNFVKCFCKQSPQAYHAL